MPPAVQGRGQSKHKNKRRRLSTEDDRPMNYAIRKVSRSKPCRSKNQLGPQCKNSGPLTRNVNFHSSAFGRCSSTLYTRLTSGFCAAFKSRRYGNVPAQANWRHGGMAAWENVQPFVADIRRGLADTWPGPPRAGLAGTHGGLSEHRYAAQGRALYGTRASSSQRNCWQLQVATCKAA